MGLSEALEETIKGKKGLGTLVSKVGSRISITAKGPVSHWLDEKFPSYKTLESRVTASGEDERPAMFFTVWKPLGYTETKKLIAGIRAKYYPDGSLNFGLGLFVRPMGDVQAESFDFSFNPNIYDGFLDAAKEMQMPVFFIISGDQWTEPAYGTSPLLEELAKNPGNLMYLNDGRPVPIKRQPSFKNMFGLAGKVGVRYLSHHSPMVNLYRDRNFRQAINLISDFNTENPRLFLGLNLRNETDFPGWWAVHGNYGWLDRNEYFADCGVYALTEFSNFLMKGFLLGLKDEHALVHLAMQRAGVQRTGDEHYLAASDTTWIMSAREYARCNIHELRAKLNNPDFVKNPLGYDPALFGLWQSFRIDTIKSRLAFDASIAQAAGIPENKIYTCQSFEDGIRRASPIETAIIPGCQIGITAWGTGNSGLYSEIRERAEEEGKNWGVMITNPVSGVYEEVFGSLMSPYLNGAGVVGLFNYSPHFPGYPIRGPLLQTDKAINALTKKSLTPL